jgi:hypothetical protein
MGQCFAVWQKGRRVLVVESRDESFIPVTGPTVYFFYEVRPSRTKGGVATLTRQERASCSGERRRVCDRWEMAESGVAAWECPTVTSRRSFFGIGDGR